MSHQWAGFSPILLPQKGVVFPTFDTGLNPQYRYLAVHAPGEVPALLLMSHVTETSAGTLESWATAEQQTLQTVDGVLHATYGLALDLRPAAVPQPDATQWQVVSFANLPAEARPVLQGSTAAWAALTWYQIPAGQYLHVVAVGLHRGTVQRVYSYRCWAEGACLHTYRWPIDYQAPHS